MAVNVIGEEVRRPLDDVDDLVSCVLLFIAFFNRQAQAISVDQDQTGPRGAVKSGSALFVMC